MNKDRFHTDSATTTVLCGSDYSNITHGSSIVTDAIGVNLSDNESGIRSLLEDLMSNPEFKTQAEWLVNHMDHIVRFYTKTTWSHQREFDLTKRESYPLAMIMENSSKSPEEKIIWIRSRWQEKWRELTESQMQYIQTMQHQDIFSRTSQEWVDLIYELKKNGFSTDQAFDICNHGECGVVWDFFGGVAEFFDKWKFPLMTIAYFYGAPWFKDLSEYLAGLWLGEADVIFTFEHVAILTLLMLCGRNFNKAVTNESEDWQLKELLGYLRWSLASAFMAWVAFLSKNVQIKMWDLDKYARYDELKFKAIQKTIEHLEHIPTRSIFIWCFIIYKSGSWTKTIIKDLRWRINIFRRTP